MLLGVNLLAARISVVSNLVQLKSVFMQDLAWVNLRHWTNAMYHANQEAAEAVVAVGEAEAVAARTVPILWGALGL